MTLDESRAFASFVGLSGGIVKLGDKLVDLKQDEINTVRALLPIYGEAARPVDAFTREFPEIWHLNVDKPLDGYKETWDLVGLFNWGYNVDMSVNPYAPIADDGAPATRSVDLSALGLHGSYLAYEFWTQTFLGEVSDKLALEVPSHSGRVVALRKKANVPQFLGWNRQITMGGTLLHAVEWDAAAHKLHVRCSVAAPTVKAPFTYEMAFFAPEGMKASGASISGVMAQAPTVAQDGQVIRVHFVPETTGEAELTVQL